jgi:CPA2 family monovalent cation:H+ antiporter-2
MPRTLHNFRRIGSRYSDGVHAPDFLAPLVLVLAAALASAYLLTRLRQPPLVGFLLAGALLGPFGLGLQSNVRAVDSLAEVGVILLLFTVGLELELPSLKRLGRLAWVAGPIQLVGTIALVTAVGTLAGYDVGRSVFFGFLVSLSSTAIVLTLLMERREMDAPHGRLLLGMLIFQDLAVVPMMLAIPALAGGAGQGLPAALAALGKTAATAALLVVAARFLVPRLLRALAGTRQKAIFVVAVLLLVFGTALAASRAGLSAALGAFLAGLVISESEYGHQAMADVLPFRDAFNALFFVSIGMLFDPRILRTEPALVGVLLLLILVGKAALAGLPVRLLGFGVGVATVVGLTLAQIGEFSFILLKQGQSFNLISPELYQAFLGAAIVSMAVTPWISERSHGFADRVSRADTGARWEERDSALPSAGHVIVLGFGHTGETLARVLGRAKVPFRILDLHPERVARAKAKGIPIEFGDGANDRVLKHAGIAGARAVLVLLSDPRATRRVVRLCRSLTPGIFLLVRTRYLTDVAELSALGADDVVAEEFETSLEIAGRTLRRLGFSLPWVEAETDEIRHARHDAFRSFRAPETSPEQLRKALGKTRVDLVAVGPGWRAAGRSLQELNLRAGGGASVLAVVRDGEPSVSPGGDFALRNGDQVLLLGTEAAVEKSVGILRG